MRTTKKRPVPKFTAGFGVSLAVTALLNAFLVILKELNPGVKAWMKGLTGHHWMTHSAILLAAYVVLGVVFSYSSVSRKVNGRLLVTVYTACVAAGCLAIVGYYLMHSLH